MDSSRSVDSNWVWSILTQIEDALIINRTQEGMNNAMAIAREARLLIADEWMRADG